jgi:hypothetical protein
MHNIVLTTLALPTLCEAKQLILGAQPPANAVALRNSSCVVVAPTKFFITIAVVALGFAIVFAIDATASSCGHLTR